MVLGGKVPLRKVLELKAPVVVSGVTRAGCLFSCFALSCFHIPEGAVLLSYSQAVRKKGYFYLGGRKTTTV